MKEVNSERLNFRLIKRVDCSACNTFFNAIYGDERTDKQWGWEFDSPNKDAKELPFIVVEKSNSIVGTQALIPVPMVDRNGVFLTAKSEETLVSPSMRGYGLFGQMYERLLVEARKQQYVSIWGFTPAIKAFEQAGFISPVSTEQLFLPLASKSVDIIVPSTNNYGMKRRIERLLLGVGIFLPIIWSLLKWSISLFHTFFKKKDPSLVFSTVGDAPLDTETLCHSFVNQWGGATIMRDRYYLKWRIFENPYVNPIMMTVRREGVLVGWIIYSWDKNNVGYVVDLMTSDGVDGHFKIAKDLIAKCVTDLKSKGVNAVRAWHVPNHPYADLVRKIYQELGFYHVRRGHPMIYRRVMESDQSSTKKDPWYITRIYTEGKTG